MMSAKNRFALLIPFGCGLLLALGQAPFSMPMLALLGFPVLAHFLLKAGAFWGGFRLGWLAGAGYFVGSIFWIVEPFFVEPEIFGWLAPFALILMAGGLALFWALGFGMAALMTGPARLIALVITLTICEFARSHVFTGFPWGLLGYVWSETPVFQLLAWIGPHGLGLLSVAVYTLPLMLASPLMRGGVFVAGMGALWAVGLVSQPKDAVPLRDVTVRIVQPNAPQHLKWHPDHIAKFFKRSVALSKGDGRAVDVVIWPETSVPFRMGRDPSNLMFLHEQLAGLPFIGGIQRQNEDSIYNSMLYLNAAGDVVATYDKSHLVPFGEYVPFANLAAKFGVFGLADLDQMGFAAGAGPRIIEGTGLPPYLPMICYEAIFPGLAQVSGARPDWLLHLTNDAWYGVFSGPYQHLVQARARAIEQGLPVARAANTGVSGMIDPFGRMTVSLPLNEQGYIDARLPAPRLATIYSQFGESIWLLFALFLTLTVTLGKHFGLMLNHRENKH